MINLIFFIVQSEVNAHKVEYMMTDNHNLSFETKFKVNSKTSKYKAAEKLHEFGECIGTKR